MTDLKLKTLIAINEANRQIYNLLDKFEKELKEKNDIISHQKQLIETYQKEIKENYIK